MPSLHSRQLRCLLALANNGHTFCFSLAASKQLLLLQNMGCDIVPQQFSLNSLVMNEERTREQTSLDRGQTGRISLTFDLDLASYGHGLHTC